MCKQHIRKPYAYMLWIKSDVQYTVKDMLAEKSLTKWQLYVLPGELVSKGCHRFWGCSHFASQHIHTGPCTNVWYLLQQLPLLDHLHFHKACVRKSLCIQLSCCIGAEDNGQSTVWVTAPCLLTPVACSCCLLVLLTPVADFCCLLLLLTPGCLLVMLCMELA